MLIAIDFDGTIVEQDGRRYDATSPLRFMPGAREALLDLNAAGHVLVLWSARARLTLRDPRYVDPLVAAGIKTARPRTPEEYAVNEARYAQMVAFVRTYLAGVFTYVYHGGELDKPGVDLFIDDKALRLGADLGGQSWYDIAKVYGRRR
jgi:hypothetical protein